jgi:hypothetical protein
MPVQLHVYLPCGGYHGVLFIENLTTFERATSSRTERYSQLALVYAAGFKGSAKRLRSVSGCSVYFSNRGSLGPADTRKWEHFIFENERLPVWFWGDLDFSGMRILSALKDTFPEITAWIPGYAPMLEALRANSGHTPEAAGKSLQQDIAVTGCPYADTVLLPALRQTGRFLDQEYL